MEIKIKKVNYGWTVDVWDSFKNTHDEYVFEYIGELKSFIYVELLRSMG